MSPAEIGFLALILVAFAAFGAGIAYYSHRAG